MVWVKKNIGFVAGLVVALVLMGVGVWYLLGNKGEAEGVDAELQAKDAELDALVKSDVFPESANIKLAKEQEERVAAFVKEARQHFTVAKKPEGLDNAEFKSRLEAALVELVREADRAGVKLPDKGSNPSYGFTFDEQRKQLQLPASALGPLSLQLGDLQNLCQVLFAAKVPALVSLKRAPVGTNEVAGGPGLLTKKVTTNAALGSVTYPYEVVFQGFSQELARVLTGLIEAPEAFIVKTLNVERGTLDAPAPSAGVVMPMTQPGGMDPSLARRYGLGTRYAPQQPVPQVAPPTANRPGEVVLEEKPLRVTLGIELVKLLPTEAPKGPPGPPPPATR
ncbi:MAG TPA: Amuc_1100 family pilus-like protein [Verrucomicrobiota bacterium]|nr:Amuc_1100 family pilus-like protein [Verrucomicrobiota bacterium]